MALLGLRPSDPLPEGGQRLTLSVRSGSGTAASWTGLFGPALEARYHVVLEPGSLNLWADAPILWQDPVHIIESTVTGEFCPVILEECAVGVAFRANKATPTYLEVLSPVHLRTRLNLSDGQPITVRLLPGSFLKAAV